MPFAERRLVAQSEMLAVADLRQHTPPNFPVAAVDAIFPLFGVLIILSRVWPAGSPGNPPQEGSFYRMEKTF